MEADSLLLRVQVYSLPLGILAVGFCREWRRGGGSLLKRVKERHAKYSVLNPILLQRGYGVCPQADTSLSPKAGVSLQEACVSTPFVISLFPPPAAP